ETLLMASDAVQYESSQYLPIKAKTQWRVNTHSDFLGLRLDVSGQNSSQPQCRNRASYSNEPYHCARLAPQYRARAGSDGARDLRAIPPQRHWRRTLRRDGRECGGQYGAQ